MSNQRTTRHTSQAKKKSSRVYAVTVVVEKSYITVVCIAFFFLTTPSAPQYENLELNGIFYSTTNLDKQSVQIRSTRKCPIRY